MLFRLAQDWCTLATSSHGCYEAMSFVGDHRRHLTWHKYLTNELGYRVVLQEQHGKKAPNGGAPFHLLSRRLSKR